MNSLDRMMEFLVAGVFLLSGSAKFFNIGAGRKRSERSNCVSAWAAIRLHNRSRFL